VKPSDAVGVSVGRLVGQLSYLFDEQPELREASVEELRARLDHDDRYARARARFPNDNDTEIVARLPEFESRVTAEGVAAALEQVGRP
jgi:hypothetical protein